MEQYEYGMQTCTRPSRPAISPATNVLLQMIRDAMHCKSLGTPLNSFLNLEIDSFLTDWYIEVYM